MSGPDRRQFAVLLSKAEEDWVVANVVMTHASAPLSVGFHLQQCAEKLMKALAVMADLEFPRTHDLNKLLRLILPKYPELTSYLGTLPDYTIFAVEPRYDSPVGFEIAELEPVFQEVGRFRDAVHALLPPELRPQ